MMTADPDTTPGAPVAWRLPYGGAVDQSKAAVPGTAEGRQFVSHNLVAGGGALLAGLFGFALQAMLSHRLHPAEYGKAFGVFTFFTLLTQPAGAFSRLMAWSTSRELSTSGGTRQSSALLRGASVPLLVAGAALAAVCVLGAATLAQYLNVPASLVYMSALGVPFMVATPALLGALQGEQRFKEWAVLSAVLAGSRVVCAGVLVVPLGVRGVLLGISVASAITYAMGLMMLQGRLRSATGRGHWRPVTRFLTVAVVSMFSLAVLLGSDVVLVDHFFTNQEGGEYGSVVAISRAVFFAMGGVTSVLFPKVVMRHASGKSTFEVVAASLGIALVCGLAGMLAFEAGGTLILRLFAGRAYLAGTGYIGWYALGMGLLACVVMLMNTHQSMDRLSLIWILIPLTALKPILIVLFHKTLLTVVVVGDVAIGVMLVVLVVLYVLDERRNLTAKLVPPPRQV